MTISIMGRGKVTRRYNNTYALRGNVVRGFLYMFRLYSQISPNSDVNILIVTMVTHALITWLPW